MALLSQNKALSSDPKATQEAADNVRRLDPKVAHTAEALKEELQARAREVSQHVVVAEAHTAPTIPGRDVIRKHKVLVVIQDDRDQGMPLKMGTSGTKRLMFADIVWLIPKGKWGDPDPKFFPKDLLEQVHTQDEVLALLEQYGVTRIDE
jgi:hypothetical protein